MAAHLQTFPAELLAEIFMLSCLSEEDGTVDIRHPPWLLTRVCKRWSSVAVTTSMLWCYISLASFDKLSSGSLLWESGFQVNLLDLHLQRSANQSLFLSLQTPLWDSMLDLLIQQAYRWEAVEFRNFNAPMLRKLQTSLVRGSTPMLKSLVIDISNSEGLVCDTFEVCPSLRSLTLYNCSVSTRIRIPWGQLTHFTAYNLNIDQAMGMLRSMPALVKCTIRQHRGPVGYNITGSAPINLPNLRVFDVETHKQALRTSMLEILQHLYMPALVDLRVRDRAQIRVLPLVSDVNLSSFPCCHIVKLSLTVSHGRTNSGIPEHDIIAILPNLPLLQELKIRGFNRISDDFLIHFFTTRENGPETCLCPSLKSFLFEGSVGVGDLLGMITKDYMDSIGIRDPSMWDGCNGFQWKAPFVISNFTLLPASSPETKLKDWMFDGHPSQWRF